MVSFVTRLPPLFPTLRGLSASALSHDVPAGLVLAAIALPGQLATAKLAGLPAEAGLFAFVGAIVGYAILGSNRFVSVGADTTTAPIFASGLAAIVTATGLPYGEMASVLATMVGIILLLAGVLRAGWIADLLSIPVTAGFLAGISVHIAVHQLPTLLGVPVVEGNIFEQLRGIWSELPQANPVVLAIGLGVFLASTLCGRRAPRFPGALLAIAVTAAAVALLGLDAKGVATLGPVNLHHPWLVVLPTHDMRAIGRLVPLSFTVAMVCMMQTAAVVREFPSTPGTDEHVSPSFFGVGLGCVLSGLLGAFPVNASPPSTAMVAAAGARSQFAGLFAVGVILLLVVFLGFLLAYVPQAALAGVLLTVAVRIFRLDEIRDIFARSLGEFALVAAAAILVIALPIQDGMLLAIVLSLLHSLYILARPKTNELARAPGTTIWWPPEAGQAGEHIPGVLVFAPAAPIHFTNARFICRQLSDAALARTDLKLVVIDASAVSDIDYTGAQIVSQTIRNLQLAGMTVALARLSAERAERQAERTGLLDAVGGDHVFRSVEDAVRALATNASPKPPHERSAHPPR